MVRNPGTTGHPRRCRRRVVLACAAALLWVPIPAHSQSWGQAGDALLSVPAWYRAWSPLQGGLDPVRRHPLELAWDGIDREGFPPPPGLAWDVGNPSGLALELVEPGASVAGTTGLEEGSYRRPLDAGAVEVNRIMGIGWTPLSERAGAAGAMSASWRTDRAPAFANLLEPHTASPHVLADTSVSSLESISTTVEGALGGRFGAWAAGVGLGARLEETRSVEAVVRRNRRHTEPGISLGLAYGFDGRSLRLGLHGQARTSVTTVYLHPLAAPTRVLRLQGFSDPVPQDITGLYFHRMERSYEKLGASMDGVMGRIRWRVLGETGTLRERQSREQSDDPPSDRWRGEMVGGGVRLELPTASFGSFHLHGEGWRLSGAAHRHGVEGTTFSAEESGWTVSGHLRLPLAEGWWWTAHVGMERDDRRQRDRFDRLDVRIRSSSPLGGSQLEAPVGSRLRVAAGYHLMFRRPAARLPSPDRVGPITRAFVLPELLLMGREARVHILEVRIARVLDQGGTIALSARRSSASPQPPPALQAELHPVGTRSRWEVAAGWNHASPDGRGR